MGTKLILLACLGSTLFMTGLIWFVQVVHYPLFGQVGLSEFGRYHANHARLTTYVVLLPMVVELLTSVALVANRPAGVGLGLAVAGLVAAGLTWASTVLVQVPLHDQLAAGFAPDVHRRLVGTNLVRALFWTAHGAIVLTMTAQALRD